MGWDHRPEAQDWTRATLAAVSTNGAALVANVPDDIEVFCPDYAANGPAERAAFWSGFLSALARFESSWNPAAKGGGGRWIGLLQIAPKTADNFGCAATDVSALQDGSRNLACGVRIMSRQVTRDGRVAGHDDGWQGAARDWAPMRDREARAAVARWTAAQDYCRIR